MISFEAFVSQADTSTVPAAVRRPSASTVNVGIAAVDPYDPAATVVLDNSVAPTPPVLIVTAPEATLKFVSLNEASPLAAVVESWISYYIIHNNNSLKAQKIKIKIQPNEKFN